MENNKELAQKIINKYISIVGLYPTLTFLRQVPNININNRGLVRFITSDLNTLNSVVNYMSRITGKMVKNNIIKKYLAQANLENSVNSVNRDPSKV
jgi:hypothetical protein